MTDPGGSPQVSVMWVGQWNFKEISTLRQSRFIFLKCIFDKLLLRTLITLHSITFLHFFKSPEHKHWNSSPHSVKLHRKLEDRSWDCNWDWSWGNWDWELRQLGLELGQLGLELGQLGLELGQLGLELGQLGLELGLQGLDRWLQLGLELGLQLADQQLCNKRCRGKWLPT